MKLFFEVFLIFTFVLSGHAATYWTNWLDRDNAGGTGDWELYQNFVDFNGGPPCNDGYDPVDANCRIKMANNVYIPWYEANQVIPACNQCTARGISCQNSQQSGGICQDYQIQFLCYKS